MRLNKKLLVLTPLIFFTLTGVVYASISVYFTQAQKYINANCSKKKIPDQTALLCYLFNKSQEHDASIAALNTTLSPIPSEINSLKADKSQEEQQIAALSQQFQALSATVGAAPKTTNWDITGTYTLRLYPIYDSPQTRTITITTVDPVTGRLGGTGSYSGGTLTVSGIVNGSQFTLQTQTSASVTDIQVQGSIAPDGTLWGVGTSSNAHGFMMTTLSGVAKKQ